LEPIFITDITDTQGHPIEFDHTRPRFERVMPAEKAYELEGMMQNVVRRGTGKRAAIGRPVAGKTGTTNDYRDAWFVGYTPDMITGVWVGYDSSRDMGHGDEGGRVAAPVWAAYMRQAMKGRPVLDFPAPNGVTMASASAAADGEVGSGRRRRSRATSDDAPPPRKRVRRHREVAPDTTDTDDAGHGG
jgi:penicillin-binding protein 1A